MVAEAGNIPRLLGSMVCASGGSSIFLNNSFLSICPVLEICEPLHTVHDNSKYFES